MLCGGDFESTMFWLRSPNEDRSPNAISAFLETPSCALTPEELKNQKPLMDQLQISWRAQAKACGFEDETQLRVFRKLLHIDGDQINEVQCAQQFFEAVKISSDSEVNVKGAVVNFWLFSLFSDLTEFKANTNPDKKLDVSWVKNLITNLLSICATEEDEAAECHFFIFLTGLKTIPDTELKIINQNFNQVFKLFSSKCRIFLLSFVDSQRIGQTKQNPSKPLLELFSNLQDPDTFRKSTVFEFGHPKEANGLDYPQEFTLASSRRKRIISEIYRSKDAPPILLAHPALITLPELLVPLKRHLPRLPHHMPSRAEVDTVLLQEVLQELRDNQQEAIKQLDEKCISLLVDYKQYKKEWPQFSLQHALLYGPSSSGKSHILSLLRDKYKDITFHFVHVAKLYSKYVGEAEENLRRAYEVAHRQQPCVVVLEGLESIAGPRSMRNANDPGESIARSLLTTLLLCLDSVEKKRDEIIITIGVSLVGPDSLDEALVRPGRLGMHVGMLG